MNLILQAVAALAIGIGAMTGLQYGYVWAVAKYVRGETVRSAVAMPQMKPLQFDQARLGTLIPKYGPIDTTAGQRAWANSLGHQVYLQNRAAANMVPLPPRIHGRR